MVVSNTVKKARYLTRNSCITKARDAFHEKLVQYKNLPCLYGTLTPFEALSLHIVYGLDHKYMSDIKQDVRAGISGLYEYFFDFSTKEEFDDFMSLVEEYDIN